MRRNRDTNRLPPNSTLAHVNNYLDKLWRLGMKALGFCLIFFYLGLVLMILYGYFYDICGQYHIAYQSYLFTIVI